MVRASCRAWVVILLVPMACFDQAPPLTSGTTQAQASADDGGDDDDSTQSAAATETNGEDSTAGDPTADADTTSGDDGPIATAPCGAGSELFAYGPLLEGTSAAFVDVARIGDTVYAFGDVYQNGEEFRTPHAWPIQRNAYGSPIMLDVVGDHAVARVSSAGGEPRLFIDEVLAFTRVFDPAPNPWLELGSIQAEQPTGVRDVVRPEPSVLWAVGHATGRMGQPFWRLYNSTSAGMTWTTAALAFTLTPAQPAVALGIDVEPVIGRVLVAGFATDVAGVEFWTVRAFDPIAVDDMNIDQVEGGRAQAIRALPDGAVVIGGSIGGAWTLRATLGDGAFATIPVEVPGSGGTVVDLQIGPGGALFALGTTTSPNQGVTLMACKDITAGPSCWTPLIEHEVTLADGDTTASRMFMDGPDIWIAATATTAADAMTRGALFRYTCTVP